MSQIFAKGSSSGPGIVQTTGVWTPTFTGQASAGKTAYTQQIGTYIKTGNLVVASFSINWKSATGTGTGVIGGLPSKAAAIGTQPLNVFLAQALTFATSYVTIGGRVLGGTDYLLLTISSIVASRTIIGQDVWSHPNSGLIGTIIYQE